LSVQVLLLCFPSPILCEFLCVYGLQFLNHDHKSSSVHAAGLLVWCLLNTLILVRRTRAVKGFLPFSVGGFLHRRKLSTGNSSCCY
jgi:hypothetical protein